MCFECKEVKVDILKYVNDLLVFFCLLFLDEKKNMLAGASLLIKK